MSKLGHAVACAAAVALATTAAEAQSGPPRPSPKGSLTQVVGVTQIDVAYSRRWWGNFFVTHNRALTPADYDEVTLTVPSDPRLPGGGGYPVTFLTRNNNSVLGASDPYYTSTSDYGDQTNYWQGVDVTLNARLNNGLTFQGGTSSGRGYSDTCDVLVGRYGRPMTPSTATVPGMRVPTSVSLSSAKAAVTSSSNTGSPPSGLSFSASLPSTCSIRR